MLWQSCHALPTASSRPFPKWAVLAINCKRQNSASKELLPSFHRLSCKRGRNFPYSDSSPQAHNKSLIKNISDSQAALLRQLSHLCLSTLHTLLQISTQKTVIKILGKSWSTQYDLLSAYYFHTPLDVAIRKSIFTLTWIAMEVFQYLKHYLPALHDVNPMHLVHGKNGHTC